MPAGTGSAAATAAERVVAKAAAERVGVEMVEATVEVTAVA